MCAPRQSLSPSRYDYTCSTISIVPYSRRRYRSSCPISLSSLAPPESVPGVSILRPLKGLDTNLFENLESTFHQEYPNFEIIFSVANEYDQALSVVQALIEKHPNFDARVIVGTYQPFRVSSGIIDRRLGKVRKSLEQIQRSITSYARIGRRSTISSGSLIRISPFPPVLLPVPSISSLRPQNLAGRSRSSTTSHSRLSAPQPSEQRSKRPS